MPARVSANSLRTRRRLTILQGWQEGRCRPTAPARHLQALSRRRCWRRTPIRSVSKTAGEIRFPGIAVSGSAGDWRSLSTSATSRPVTSPWRAWPHHAVEGTGRLPLRRHHRRSSSSRRQRHRRRRRLFPSRRASRRHRCGGRVRDRSKAGARPLRPRRQQLRWHGSRAARRCDARDSVMTGYLGEREWVEPPGTLLRPRQLRPFPARLLLSRVGVRRLT